MADRAARKAATDKAAKIVRSYNGDPDSIEEVAAHFGVDANGLAAALKVQGMYSPQGLARIIAAYVAATNEERN